MGEPATTREQIQLEPIPTSDPAEAEENEDIQELPSPTPKKHPDSDEEETSFHKAENRRISFAKNVDEHQQHRARQGSGVAARRARSDSQWSRLDFDMLRSRCDTTGSMWSNASFTTETDEVRPSEDNYLVGRISSRVSLRQLMKRQESLLDGDEVDGGGGKSEGGRDSGDAEDGLKVTAAAAGEGAKFGWVKGVLARCLLNIWGVMIFLRVPWCVGQAGILRMVAIVLISTLITTITTLSMSAICTNGFIKGGGAYYLISRSLGPEIGGATGIVFAFANAVAVAMYVIGFAESVRDLLVQGEVIELGEYGLWDVRIIGFITCVFILVIALVGLSLVVKVQLTLLFLLIVAILDAVAGSFRPTDPVLLHRGFTGYNMTTFTTNLHPDYDPDQNFFTVLAIFFPAATGILAGANISGDLRKPEVAIPKGTLLAIFISTSIYLILSVICGCTMVREAGWDGSVFVYGLLGTLTGQVMPTMSFTTYSIIAGVYAASLSSAIASLVGAPKVFQAVASDNLFPYISFFGKGSSKDNEPRRGYILTFCIGLAFTAIGELDAIAPLISNFFLVSYALINGACFIGSISNSPGWRPTFRWYNKWLALLGFIGCSSIMFLIEYKTALVTFFIIGAIFAYLTFREPDVNWGTSTQAFAYVSTLHSILRLQHTPDHVRTYRPQILAFTGNPMERQALVTLVSCVTKNSSMMVCGNIIDGAVGVSLTPDNNPPAADAPQQQQPTPADVRKWIAACRVKSFYTQIMASNYRQGAASLMQVTGLGKFKPNVIFMGYKEDWQTANPKDVEDYVNVIYDAFDFESSVCIFRNPSPSWRKNKAEVGTGLTSSKRNRSETVINLTHGNIFENAQPEGTIDIWWLYDDGGLTVLIPHLLSLNWRWAHCKLRVFISGSRSKEDEEKRRMHELLRKFRIEVRDVNIIPEIKGRPTSAAWDAYSAMQAQFVLDDDLDDSFSKAFVSLDQSCDPKCVRLCKRQVRIGETVGKYSRDATLVIINLPMPANIDQGHYMYMCWLETLSHHLPPSIVMRGNQESVLTFYS